VSPSRRVLFSLADNATVSFPMPWLYEQLFEKLVLWAVQEQPWGPSERCQFLEKLKDQLVDNYAKIMSQSPEDARLFHKKTLRRFRSEFEKLRSNSVCLSCLLNIPETVLPCGHALCETCIRLWAPPDPETCYHYTLTSCPLCGSTKDRTVRLLPPTAGIRLLSLDGGGIKGIVPIIILSGIAKTLEPLGVPLRDHFDFVCGTSAGKPPSSIRRLSE
jgi:hypothetical protein